MIYIELETVQRFTGSAKLKPSGLPSGGIFKWRGIYPAQKSIVRQKQQHSITTTTIKTTMTLNNDNNNSLTTTLDNNQQHSKTTPT